MQLDRERAHLHASRVVAHPIRGCDAQAGEPRDSRPKEARNVLRRRERGCCESLSKECLEIEPNNKDAIAGLNMARMQAERQRRAQAGQVDVS